VNILRLYGRTVTDFDKDDILIVEYSGFSSLSVLSSLQRVAVIGA
jgi:hypothetical protein